MTVPRQDDVPMLEARDVRVVRGGVTVVDAVSLSGRAGEMLGIGGPSGSGKTSLLTVLAGVTRPESGSVTLRGRRWGPDAPDRDVVGVVLQGYGLVPVLTAAENVEVALQARGRHGSDVGAAAAEVLRRVQLDGMGHRLVERLSGGQQQRVAVARAIVHAPALLVADEPTSELDEAARDHVVQELRAEADRGALVVLASHDPDVLGACDRTYWMETVA
jgi:putative ABC transport system ATP-binding protein